MIIDTHTHLLDTGHWPNEWWDWVAEDWAKVAPGRQPSMIRDKIEAGLIDPDGSRMIASMDAAGVDMSIILPIDWGLDFTGTKPITKVVEHARWLTELHPGRLLAFGSIDPRRPEATDLVSEWLQNGIRGLKLYPSCGWHPASDAATQVYELCHSAGVPVLFHTGDPLPVLDRDLSNPALLTDVATAFPNMPIWLGHAGAPLWWDEALSLAQTATNVSLEMSVWIWDDTPPAGVAQFVAKVAEAIGLLGVNRMIFGTDNVSGPRVRKHGFLTTVLAAYTNLPTTLKKHGVELSESDLALILGGNALRDLKLDAQPVSTNA